jgi:hypothetical protein
VHASVQKSKQHVKISDKRRPQWFTRENPMTKEDVNLLNNCMDNSFSSHQKRYWAMSSSVPNVRRPAN